MDIIDDEMDYIMEKYVEENIINQDLGCCVLELSNFFKRTVYLVNF